MARYHHPGVYFEWEDRQQPGVLLARADIAGFVGIAVRGPVGVPVVVETWNQFTTVFGTFTPAGYLAFAVQGFFANGGSRCWVVRVASQAASPGQWTLTATSGKPALTLVAASPGAWASQLQLATLPLGRGLFTLTLSLPDGRREVWRSLDSQSPYVDVALNADLAVRVSLIAAELWEAPPQLVVQPTRSGGWVFSVGQSTAVVTLDSTSTTGFRVAFPEGAAVLDVRATRGGGALPGAAGRAFPFTTPSRFAARLLNARQAGSTLVRVAALAEVPDPRCTPAFQPGREGLSDLDAASFTAALDELARIDEIAVLAVPDLHDKPLTSFRQKPRKVSCTSPVLAPMAPPPPPPPEMPPAFGPGGIAVLQQAMVAQSTLLGDRVALLDAPAPDLDRAGAQQWRDEFDSTYAACQYPWLRVPDPLGSPGSLRAIPACGHMAGVYARVEHQVGVHKPPANEVLLGVEDVTIEVDDTVHGLLNIAGVNVLRPTHGRQVRVLGARTASSAASWRYVNIRRLFLALERSLRTQLQWIAFEPSNPSLWLSIDRVVRSYLESLWLRGLLDGTTREAAYTVTCDATTNPPAETDNGRVVCKIGVLPPWPAEFLIVRIGITEGSVEMLSPAEAQVA